MCGEGPITIGMITSAIYVYSLCPVTFAWQHMETLKHSHVYSRVQTVFHFRVLKYWSKSRTFYNFPRRPCSKRDARPHNIFLSLH